MFFVAMAPPDVAGLLFHVIVDSFHVAFGTAKMPTGIVPDSSSPPYTRTTADVTPPLADDVSNVRYDCRVKPAELFSLSSRVVLWPKFCPAYWPSRTVASATSRKLVVVTANSVRVS